MIAGHLDHPPVSGVRHHGREFSIASKSAQQELEADVLGTRILLGRSYERTHGLLRTRLEIAGPFLFFALDEMVRRVEETIRTALAASEASLIADHPRTEQRSAVVRAEIARIVGEDSFDIAEKCVTWTSEVTNLVVGYFESFPEVVREFSAN